jgi:hypothetical protein
MPSPRGEQPNSSRPDLEKDLADIDKLKTNFDQELTRSEKSGDFSKSMALKKEIDERVAALRARVETMYAFEPALPNEKADLEFAEKLFGPDYIGPNQVEDTWGIDIQRDQIPEIPFSRPELERAKELDQFLILRAAKNRHGTLLTMSEMYLLLNKSMVDRGRGKLLLSTSELLKLNSHFFEDEPPVLGADFAWALTGKKIIPNSNARDYVSQTDVIAQYVSRNLFKGKTPSHYEGILAQYYKFRLDQFGVKTTSEIKEELLSPNWSDYADKLTRLEINEALRQSAPQALFDAATYYEVNDVRLLANTYTWTTSQTAQRDVVYFGEFDASGAHVDHRGPGLSSDVIGVLPSRTF